MVTEILTVVTTVVTVIAAGIVTIGFVGPMMDRYRPDADADPLTRLAFSLAEDIPVFGVAVLAGNALQPLTPIGQIVATVVMVAAAIIQWYR